MGIFTDKIKNWWLTAEKGQKLVTLGGIAAIICLFGAVFMVAFRPRYETLFANLTEQEQSSVVTDLQGMGFDVKFDRAGVVEVAASEKAMARIKLAAANKLPKAQGQWGLDALNTMPFGVTPSVEQERLKAITEGEISKSIVAMDGIDNARVHITLPQKSAFADERLPVTASISLTTSADSSVGPNQGRAIALLVKNAVEGLELKDVVVVDQHLTTLWNGADDASTGSGAAQKKTELDEEISKRRQRELQTALDNVFGAGAAIVTVHADVDLDASKTITNKKTPSAAPSVVETQKEAVDGTPAAVGGKTGVNGEVAPGATTSAQGKGSYLGTTQNKQYFENDVQNETTKATGGLRGMAINVVIDTTRISDQAKVEQLCYGDLGDRIQIDPTTQKPLPNQPYKVTVTGVEFDKTAAKAADTAAKSQARQQQMQQILSILPIGALLLVAALVIKQVAKFARSQAGPIMTTPEGFSMSVGGSGNGQALPESRASEAELSNLLAELDGTTMVRRSANPPYDEEPIDVEDIKNRVHMPLEQLKKMAHERPALVAQLIKSMLLEERK
jgi:flagellar M-ring protein FliF